MSKKQKQRKPHGWLIAPSQIEAWLDDAGRQAARGDHERAIATCRRILAYTPANAPQRVDALGYLGGAYMMLRRFDEAYAAFSEAVRLAPDESDLWYNLGLAARFTSRTAESVLDLERAAALEGNGELAAPINEELVLARSFVKTELKDRGPEFTLERLAEQQDLFQRATNLMETGQWAEAEEGMRRVIAMADVLPQPWGNLGLALLMQRRFDEAEAALRQRAGNRPQLRDGSKQSGRPAENT